MSQDLARTKLEEYVEKRGANARAVVEQVMSQVPVDRIVPAHRLVFAGSETPMSVAFPLTGNGSAAEGLHQNALRQIASRADLPTAYADDLNQTAWGRALLATNLNELYRNRFTPATRFLTRSVGSEMRGFLSSRYRRMDSRPILDSLLGAIQHAGAVVTDGIAGDVRVSLKAILPRIVEPIPGEHMVFGIAWTNSDFGCGAMEVDLFALRLVCLNGMIASVEMRKVHLGARLGDDLEYSQKTYDLDTRTVASATRDQVRALLEPAKIDALAERIRKAAESTIDPKATVRSLRSTLSKVETEAVVSAFNSPDVVNLPPGNTAWRLSNAVSFLAGNTKDPGRRIELERAAGELVAAA